MCKITSPSVLTKLNIVKHSFYFAISEHIAAIKHKQLIIPVM